MGFDCDFGDIGACNPLFAFKTCDQFVYPEFAGIRSTVIHDI
jgi:hypothetical protein